MLTRSQLLKSKLASPDMSTSPSGLAQAEQPRHSHPATVQAFNVAPAVLAYIDGLPAKPERYKPIDYKKISVSHAGVIVHVFGHSMGHVLACVMSCSVC